MRAHYAFRSKLEADFASALDERGITFTYEEQKYPITLPSPKHECRMCGCRKAKEIRRHSYYTPDFHVYGKDGSLLCVIETKGHFTGRDRAIATAFKEGYAAMDYRMFFGNDNRLSKTSETHYSDWCNANKIPFAVRHFPATWTKEFA